ncbi:TraR/DksA family transcriptional regulator [Streptomyces sp. 049-1]|uniref:TraR/DksA family transcriptional regulator n=1 Tax=Streptomyces sp. 049-1 TaxID=2789264 RepID=UPI00398118A7
MNELPHDGSDGRDAERVRAGLMATENALRARINEAEGTVTSLRGDCDLDAADVGVRNAATDRLQADADAARALLEQTSAALERLDDGSYGLCVSCGESVEAARLAALPYAAQCLACKVSGSPVRRGQKGRRA